jgi:hypothetical protein
MSAYPGNYNIDHYRGDTFLKYFRWKDDDGDPVDMSGGTLLAQIRQSTAYTATVYATFTVQNEDPVNGYFELYLAPDTLKEAAWTRAFWDVQFTYSSGEVQTLVFGEFNLTDDVSHE